VDTLNLADVDPETILDKPSFLLLFFEKGNRISFLSLFTSFIEELSCQLNNQLFLSFSSTFLPTQKCQQQQW
jgi:hypothetical protein